MNLIDSIDNALLQMAGRHTEVSNLIIEKLNEAKRLAVLEELANQHIRDENLPGARPSWNYMEG